MKSLRLIGIAIALLLPGATAQAGISISRAPTENMSCNASVCTPTAKRAVLNVGQLSRMLRKSDVQVVAHQNTFDIDLSAPLTWTSGHSLTLDASDKVTFEKPLTIAGSGGLNLLTGDSGFGGGYLYFSGKGHIIFWDLNSKLNINRASYTLVSTIAQLASAVSSNSASYFALANDYDAKNDGVYDAAPVATPLSGGFEGLGNRLSNLTIAAPSGDTQKVGLFAQVGIVADLGIDKANVSMGDGNSNSYVGAITGWASLLVRCWAKGVVTGGDSTVVGGLTGGGGNMSGSHFSGKVSGGRQATVGGLAGSHGGLVDHVWTEGKVRGGDDSEVGGLFGVSASDVSFSHSSSNVKAGGAGVTAGGLVGYNISGIENSHATGSVIVGDAGSNVALAGGLVGSSDGGRVTASFATGDVKGGYGATVGGLIGTSEMVSQSFATGHVEGGPHSNVGGFAGVSTNTLSDNYALGNVHGGHGSSVGGFVGLQLGTVETSYSVGTVNGGSDTGGFAGTMSGEVSADYWDLDTSGIADPAQGCGNISNCSGVTGSTDSQLKSALPVGFDQNIWGQDQNINNGYPYLLTNPPL